MSGYFSKTSLRVTITFCGMPKDSLILLITEYPAFISRTASSGENGAAAIIPFSIAAARNTVPPMARKVTSLSGLMLYFLRKAFMANSEYVPAPGYANHFAFEILHPPRLFVAEQDVIGRARRATDNR